MARHFTHAGLSERAVQYWLKAGQQALARSVMVEAETLLRKGLKLLPGLADVASRQEHELDFQIALGQVLIQILGLARPRLAKRMIGLAAFRLSKIVRTSCCRSCTASG